MDRHRRKIASGWSPSSGVPQAEYCRQHGISPRTLRAWRERHAVTDTSSLIGVRREVAAAVEALQKLLYALDAAAACHPADYPPPVPAPDTPPKAAAAPACHAADDLEADAEAVPPAADDAERQPPGEPPNAPEPSPVAVPAPEQPRRKGFVWDLEENPE